MVAHLGAVQAQDYLGALWAVGLRMKKSVEADVERALNDRSIVRTWPFRGTLHFVAAEDARWMLALTAKRVQNRYAAQRERDYGLTPSVLRRSASLVQKELRGGGQLTRPELYAALKLRPDAGLRVLWHLAHEGMICFGPRRGKQQTFVLLDEWLPAQERVDSDDALRELTRRYFVSHGPATEHDFAWWSALPLSLVRKGLEMAAPHLASESHGRTTYWYSPDEGKPSSGGVHLLPPFDEFTVGYRDRTAVLDPAFARKVNAGGGMLQAVVVIDGKIAGTWKRTLHRDAVEIMTTMFRALKRGEKRDLEAAAERYRRFLGVRSVTGFEWTR